MPSRYQAGMLIYSIEYSTLGDDKSDNSVDNNISLYVHYTMSYWILHSDAYGMVCASTVSLIRERFTQNVLDDLLR